MLRDSALPVQIRHLSATGRLCFRQKQPNLLAANPDTGCDRQARIVTDYVRLLYRLPTPCSTRASGGHAPERSSLPSRAYVGCAPGSHALQTTPMAEVGVRALKQDASAVSPGRPQGKRSRSSIEVVQSPGWCRVSSSPLQSLLAAGVGRATRRDICALSAPGAGAVLSEELAQCATPSSTDLEAPRRLVEPRKADHLRIRWTWPCARRSSHHHAGALRQPRSHSAAHVLWGPGQRRERSGKPRHNSRRDPAETSGPLANASALVCWTWSGASECRRSMTLKHASGLSERSNMRTSGTSWRCRRGTRTSMGRACAAARLLIATTPSLLEVARRRVRASPKLPDIFRARDASCLRSTSSYPATHKGRWGELEQPDADTCRD